VGVPETIDSSAPFAPVPCDETVGYLIASAAVVYPFPYRTALSVLDPDVDGRTVASELDVFPGGVGVGIVAVWQWRWLVERRWWRRVRHRMWIMESLSPIAHSLSRLLGRCPLPPRPRPTMDLRLAQSYASLLAPRSSLQN
jgi:hypothetical protein